MERNRGCCFNCFFHSPLVRSRLACTSPGCELSVYLLVYCVLYDIIIIILCRRRVSCILTDKVEAVHGCTNRDIVMFASCRLKYTYVNTTFLFFFHRVMQR